MKEMLRYGLILAFICMIASGLLATVNMFTAPRIIAAAQAEEEASLKEVMPAADRFEAVKDSAGQELLYYKAFDKQGKMTGVVFKASGKGYSSVIQTLAGMFPDGSLSAIKVVSLSETPGLGMRVTEDKFTGQFKGAFGTELSGVQAITGATISSRAVIDSVKEKAQEVEDLLKSDKSGPARGSVNPDKGELKYGK